MQQREKAKAEGKGKRAGAETVGRGRDSGKRGRGGGSRGRDTEGQSDRMAGRDGSQRVVCGLDKAPATA